MACTVVSVVPYRLTSRGCSSPYRSSQAASVRTSRASPANSTYRSAASGSAASASAAASWPNAVGVWLHTVTRCRASNARNSAGSRLTSHGTTTSRPPVSQAPHISNTDTSKAAEWNRLQASSGPTSSSDQAPCTSRTTFSWVTSVPFGRPVEPEV